MPASDDVNHRRLLLGTRDWQRPDWVEAYYPPDLPSDWRLTYYANDAGCVLLPAATWSASAPDLDEQLEEAPAHLLFFLEAAQDAAAYDVFERRFRGRDAVLIPTETPVPAGLPCWDADPAGGWRDPEGRGLLQRLDLPVYDLKALRRDIEGLPPETSALILEGKAASPGRLAEVRLLVEMLGRG